MVTPSGTAGPSTVEYDFDEVAPTEAVCRTVATMRDRTPREIGPLYGSVEPDALNAIVRHARARGTLVEVSFTVEGVRVDVTSDGTLTVHPGGDDTDPG